MTGKMVTGVEAGYLICRRCTETKPPGRRFKVYATDTGKREMELHVKYCKSN